jgi:tetratricopeptide (TPR) repeat protein
MLAKNAPPGSDKVTATLYEAVVARPNDTRALLRLAEHTAKAGNAPLACEAYSRAGNIFLAQNTQRSARAAFTNALQVAQSGALPDRVARIARAVWKLNMNEGLTKEALATIDTSAAWLVERGFDDLAVPLFEARVSLEDSEAVRLRLAESLARTRQTSRAAGELLTVFMRVHAQGRRDKALEVGERYLTLKRDADVARECAKLYVARNGPGDAFRAIATLRVCHEAQPTHVPTLNLLARAFELAGHGDKAEKVRDEIATIRGVPKKKKPSIRPPRPSNRPPRPSLDPVVTVTETSVISLSIADVEVSALEQEELKLSHLQGPPPNLFGPPPGKAAAKAPAGRREDSVVRKAPKKGA